MTKRGKKDKMNKGQRVDHTPPTVKQADKQKHFVATKDYANTNIDSSVMEHSPDMLASSSKAIIEQMEQSREILYPQMGQHMVMPGYYSVKPGSNLQQQTKAMGQINQTLHYPMHYPMPQWSHRGGDRGDTQLQTNNMYQASDFSPPQPPPPPLANLDANELPSWVHILHGIESKIEVKLSSIETQLINQNKQITTQNRNFEKTLHTYNSRLTELEKQVTETRSINSEVKQSVSNVANKIQGLTHDMKTQKNAMMENERSVQAFSDLFDDFYQYKDETDEKVENLQNQIHKLKVENDELRSKQNKLRSNQDGDYEKLLEIECRNMEDNLVFYGIHEEIEPLNQYENTEETLKTFLKEKMGLEDMVFNKVHRLGRKQRYQLNPRPILAKFSKNKDKEQVKYAAARKLKDTRYGVREQFPKEIEERRKPLYSELKKAKEGGHYAKLVRDKLYINNQRYIHKEHKTKEDSQKNKSQSIETNYNNQGRVFYSKDKQINQVKATVVSKEGYLTPVFNRFNALNNLDPPQADKQSIVNTTNKRAARSPLDLDVQVKKHRDTCKDDRHVSEGEDSMEIVCVSETNVQSSNASQVNKNDEMVNDSDNNGRVEQPEHEVDYL